MKKIFTMVTIIVVLATLTACGRESIPAVIYVYSDYPEYPSVEALSEEAALIVRAEILDNGNAEMRNIVTPLPNPIPAEWLEHFESGRMNHEMFEPHYEVRTVYRARVLEVFSGNAQAGDIIEVLQKGGELNGQLFISDSSIPFTAGDDLVLFLLQSSHDNSVTRLLTPWQAVYRFTPGRGRMSDAVANDVSRVLEIVDERNEFSLTVGDLRG
jgi:hypothetical protein